MCPGLWDLAISGITNHLLHCMCLQMYICKYKCMYVYMRVYACMYECMCINACTYLYMYEMNI